jgi:hypothetical protein
MSSAATGLYVTRGILPSDAISYVAGQTGIDLRDALAQGEFWSVLTARQMGKPSLLVSTGGRLRGENATNG